MIPPANHCIHHVANKCTACLCQWQDKKDATVCTLKGIISHDRLSARAVEDYGFPSGERRVSR
jgi:hypothetical protein